MAEEAAAVVTNHIEPQPFYCLFPPVAESVRPLTLNIKLDTQLKKQSQLVPPVPLSLDEAINGQIAHWLPSYIEELLFYQMCEIEVQVQDPKANSGNNIIRRYYVEAAKYASRISAGNFDGLNAKYRPVFEIHHKDFSARLQAELQLLLKDSPDTLNRVVQNAVFRIFKARHKRIFFGYIENEGLNWRFVAD
jgi:hypothetical protein